MVEGQRVRRANSAVRLGDIAQQLMTEQISPRQEKFGSVAEVWDLMLPTELAQHCEIVGVSGGLLKVQVDSPSYMYELQLCSSQLLEELQQQCPKARLTKIKFVVS